MGKSNLFNAIQYTLAEQSHKKQRLENFSDVISKDSESKLAEVTINFRNDKLQKDFSITRTVRR